MSLHSDIMNIKSYRHLIGDSPVQAYKLGHLDARHAAAELALKADARIKMLEWQIAVYEGRKPLNKE